MRSKYNAREVGHIDSDVGMSDREIDDYSVTRALLRLSSGKPLDGLEAEASNALAKKIRREPQEFFIPQEVTRRSFSTRGLNATTPSAGGYVIGTETLGSSMIELLRNRTIVTAMGARTLGGLVGDIAIPTHKGGATAYWLSELAEVTSAQQNFGQILLSRHRLCANTAFSKQLLTQASIEVEGFVRMDLRVIIAIEKDRACINGSGVQGEPPGILNTSGINSLTFGAAPTWAKVVDFEKEIDSDNALQGSLGYVSTPTTKAKWKTTVKVTNQAVFLLQDGKANDYRFESSKQIPSDRVIFGDWSQAIIGDWAGIEIVVDPYSRKKTAEVEVTVNVMTDFALRHVEAFCASTDSGAQ